MALTLYGGLRSRASMPRWYMAEKGISFSWTVLDLEAGEHRAEPFLAINPFGKVPALVDEDPALPGGRLQLFESGAILLYLAERYGSELGSPAERALAEQWVLFANATLATALFVPSSREREFPRLLEVLDGLLAQGPLLGDGWSVADCAVHAHLAYLPIFFPQIDLSPWPHVQATIAATQARPAYRAVMGLA
ncbi:glutathione S-transferase family protein [Vulcanococcus limneticus Candia 3F8]|uniref:glutathione S-transferase family protein n=1 Tax=Vulcanococcus limneticus TaxID=2170428 RepID=UPI000B9816F8|nr:glutathione S-transferase family protein [Vulcanococcus limneticus]MCP9791839.1 glutathione S-transferase family protein [Vulcanococcus limneticus MW73D5]MCP9895250.1 glutathione S-transferase family protein [Vulcanococcus limneticus Candia 3F8]MCP9897295.1 glutathione S-transferase family protein [Vulcanococcus limneticus Candia 3B3]